MLRLYMIHNDPPTNTLTIIMVKIKGNVFHRPSAVLLSLRKNMICANNCAIANTVMTIYAVSARNTCHPIKANAENVNNNDKKNPIK